MSETIVSTLQPGTVLQGPRNKYIIQQTLGQGSFGITYLASTQMQVTGQMGSFTTTVRVAVKEFFMKEVNGREGMTVTSSSHAGYFADYKRKFLREAENLTKLQHPNIVKVLESFEANDTAYYAMEYLGGGSLDYLIKQRGALRETEALSFAHQIGSALTCMHTHQMLHLDLKPSNVMLRESGEAVLIDFGLSKQFDKNGDPESSTSIGGGTPGYAPMEQNNYQRGDGLPVTMDVYALGATLYKMLTGQRPPEASQLFNDGFPTDVLKKRNISTGTIEAIMKAMAPSRRDRYQNIKDMLSELALTLDEETTMTAVSTAAPQPLTATPVHSTSRLKKIVAACAGVVVLVVGGLVVMKFFQSQDTPSIKDLPADLTTIAVEDIPRLYPFRKTKECPINDPLNPMDEGIILGWTHVAEAIAAGGEYEPREKGDYCIKLHGHNYWDQECDGIINSSFFSHTEEMPEKWEQAGLSFSMSYNEWIAWLNQHGYQIRIEEAPTASDEGLYAELYATNPDYLLTFHLIFNYSGNNSLDAVGTLFTIDLQRDRIYTKTTDYTPYFPVMKVIPCTTTLAQLEDMGMTLSTFGDFNQWKYAQYGDTKFYNDAKGGDIVKSINVDNSVLLAEWSHGEMEVMTYNKWMAFFEEHGFRVIKDETVEKPDADFPEVRALQPLLGLRIDVKLNRFDNENSKDDASKIRDYSIKAL